MDRYISIRQVIDDVLVHPLLQDLSLERAVNYAVDFMRIVGCPKIFHEKVEKIQIEDYRGPLPCDYINVIQVKDKEGYCFRYSTDSFHHSYIEQEPYDLTYKIQGMMIYTSIRKGEIEMAYRAIMVDDEGYPLIPDDSSFTNALQLYIKKKHFTILFDLGKISHQVLANTQQEYCWAVGQAQSSLTIPSVDQMQSIVNLWTTLVPRMNSHREGFRTEGSQEKIRLQ